MELPGAARRTAAVARRVLSPATGVRPELDVWPPTSVTAVAYAAVFGLVGAVVAAQPAARQDAWLAVLSTNVVNLATHPVTCLVGSAFVTQDSVGDWVALALIGLACAGQALGNLRLAALVATTHVVGTLVSESVLGLRVEAGLAPLSDRFIVDIGPSFVVAPALVLGVLLGSNLGRVLSGLAFALLEPHLFVGLLDLDVSAVGHTTAIVIAVLTGPALARDWRRCQTLVDPLRPRAVSGGPLGSPAWFSRSP